jgi:selenocysteine lyase/cysteine desulfurase
MRRWKPKPAFNIWAGLLLLIAALAGAALLGIPTVTPRVRHAGIACIRPADADATSARLNEARVAHSVREGTIRLSPHCYTTAHDVELAIDALR